jgi:hypothetical protein
MTERKENPKLVAINKRSREVWATVERLAEKRAKEAPSALAAAVDRIEWMKSGGVPPKLIPSIESLLVGDGLKQSQRAQGPRAREELDALDRLILKGREERMSAKALWRWIIKTAEDNDALEVESDRKVIRVRYDQGRPDRIIAESSFPAIVSQLIKRIKKAGSD